MTRMTSEIIDKIKKLTAEHTLQWTKVENTEQTYESVSNEIHLQCGCERPNEHFELTLGGKRIQASTVVLGGLCKTIKDQITDSEEIESLWKKFCEGLPNEED